MYLTHLSLTSFRSFARLDMDTPRRVILLTGSNAQGKTSVLEAVYFLAAFTSFQTHTDGSWSISSRLARVRRWAGWWPSIRAVRRNTG
jgi:recombinational DNA repair ATPase RecF